MDQVKIETLCDGVEGCFIAAKHFKTFRISISFFVPMRRETAAANALLTGILTRASAEYPDFTAVNARLHELYGASIYGSVSKFGDLQRVKFVISALDDRYTLQQEQISKQAAEMLLSMLFAPPLEDGLFRQADFEREKRLLIENIQSELNEKRSYAIARTESIICAGEPYGIPKYGMLEDAQALTNQQAVQAWQTLLAQAFVRINVVAAAAPQAVYEQVQQQFAGIQRQVLPVTPYAPHRKNAQLKEQTETMDVTQDKLCMAYCMDVSSDFQSRITARIMADVLGGGPYSLCFQNVREKQSLCYYCAARANTQKNIVLIDSGVLPQNSLQAQQAIAQQVQLLQDGAFTDEMLQASKMAIADYMRTLQDSPELIDAWYGNMVFEAPNITLSAYTDAVWKVSRQQVIQLAKTLELDTVYQLRGVQKEAE